jgi:2-octaprenyl-6-methoxyphenol hydroxylase
MAEERGEDIIIVGGGHAGLLAGAVLASLRFKVRLIERKLLETLGAGPADGRALALLAGSVRIAERFGVWPHLAPHGAAIWRTEVAEPVTGRSIVYDAGEDGVPFGYGFESRLLHRGLRDAFSEMAGPDRFTVGEIAGLERAPERAALVLQSGQRLAARLVIAADGRQSKLRQLARIGTRTWRYGQTALTLVVEHERPHAHVVREWLRPEGPLALLPLPGQRSGVTWVDGEEAATARSSAGSEALLATLESLTGGILGRLRLASGPSLYPLGALHAERYVAPRLALVGDAAHGVHPIHAQGLNMGVADIAALADALAAARARGIDIGLGDALVPYARRRRPENDRRLLLTDALNRLFSNNLAPLARARGLALAAVDRLPPLKQLAIRHGMQVE